ncbi:MAG TPA: translocation/assembly module TamB domain-containing protein [Bryobacteraceae bacterium]|nr:translocation/assembly module TamB domain-containing protein [Bryobacteraceae bacterium]
MTRGRKLSIAAAAAVAALVVLAGSAWLVLESRWLRGRVHDAIVAEAERATGGRVEIGSFRFDWKGLRAELDNCTLHGTEPSGKPPLFHAARIAVGLKIVSLWKRDIDLRSIDVAEPRMYLMILPDGRTNLPQPKSAGGNTIDTILNLAIGRFDLSRGTIQVEAAGGPGSITPFHARGENLSAQFRYAAGPRYQGTLSIHPLDLNGIPLALDLTASLERGRITLASGRIATGNSAADLSDGVIEFAPPRASLQYDARISLRDVAGFWHEPALQGGEAHATGAIAWSEGAPVTATGNLHAADIAYRDSLVSIRRGALSGPFTATPSAVELREATISAACRAGRNEESAQGRIADIALRGRNLELRGIALETMGGTFRGQASLAGFDRYRVQGEISGFAGRRVVALYSAAPLPWNALAAGSVRLEGSLRRSSEFRAEAQIVLAPAEDSAPVHGRISATYEARTRTLDLARSTLALPSSRAEFSGSPGALRVRLETSDLNDLLPVLGEKPAALPVRLEGEAGFDGFITGPLDRPQFSGHLTAGRFRVEDRSFDSFQADVTASPENVHLQNAVLLRGPLRASFDAAAALDDWHMRDSSAIFGKASIANAPVADLLALAGAQTVQATGTLTAAANFSGTMAKPLATADVTVENGSLRGEPFDRLSGRIQNAGDTVTLQNGTGAAGAKQLTLAASFQHAPGRFDTGQLHWQVATNVMPLDQIRTFAQDRPGVQGTLELHASGDLNLTPALRVAALNADISARGLQLSGRPLGNAHLVAASQGQTLHTQIEADVAGSIVRGDGTVGLEGDYPVSGALTFTRLDLARLRPWISEQGSASFAGSAEGGLRISGSALKPEALQGELRISRLEITPPETASPARNFVLANSGPVVASFAGTQITIQSARMAGPATDITISGKIDLRGSSPLNLRVNGHFDAAAIHEFDSDFTASGSVLADAAVRGAPSAPQITGRVQFEKLDCSVAGFPNGLSNAAGVILFTGNRATIQTFTGETGGGKVQLSGFAGYDGRRLVFQLQAQAHEVRIRYPEGVSTVADANLRLTGTSDRSTLGGTITVRRSGFNPQSDFSSIVARSAEPLETPAARQGVLAGINFDVQIDTAPDVQVQSSLTSDLQVEANLRLRGTLSNPALIGRVNITQGQVVFYGTKYNVRQGSITFSNALKIEPIFDIDLETKANGVVITLTVSGPLHHLNLTPRSDPPLQFSEIVALLATGTAPSGDPNLMSQQTAIPQGWQQLGASTLLGEAIANPVAGRLQRFFGVSKLRIDPTLPGVEINNPQARVTLEQQVTPDIIFTYIVNVTSSNPQVVRLEWSLSKQWSVVALREENGVFGLDFFFKKRF